MIYYTRWKMKARLLTKSETTKRPNWSKRWNHQTAPKTKTPSLNYRRYCNLRQEPAPVWLRRGQVLSQIWKSAMFLHWSFKKNIEIQIWVKNLPPSESDGGRFLTQITRLTKPAPALAKVKYKEKTCTRLYQTGAGFSLYSIFTEIQNAERKPRRRNH